MISQDPQKWEDLLLLKRRLREEQYFDDLGIGLSDAHKKKLKAWKKKAESIFEEEMKKFNEKSSELVLKEVKDLNVKTEIDSADLKITPKKSNPPIKYQNTQDYISPDELRKTLDQRPFSQ